MKTSHTLENTGFTLVELLVAVAIIGILAVWAVPHFSQMMKRYEVKRVIHAIKPLFNEARVIALTQHQHVVVCQTNDTITCTKGADAIMSFIDSNTNQQRDATEQVINHVAMPLRYGQLKFNVGLGRRYIRYFPDTGKPRGFFANVTYCPHDLDMRYAKAIILNEHGRARISFDKNQDGIDEGGNRRPLRC